MKKELKEIFKENIIYFIILLVFIIIFLIMKYNFSSEIQKFDDYILTFIGNNFRSDQLTAVMKYITCFGGPVILVSILVLSFIFLKNKLYSFLIALNLSFVYLFNQLLKNIFMRPRPYSEFIPDITGFSFPSGHAMCSIAFYGLLAYFSIKYISNKFLKSLLVIFFIILILAIGASRIYLSVHYFTDVICGFLLGILALGIFINIMRKYLKE